MVEKNLKNSFLKHLSFFICFMVFLSLSLKSQDVSINQISVSQSVVCQNLTFTVVVRNDATVDWENNVLTVQLPCGLNYIPSSVTGWTESDITRADAPKFSLNTIPQKQERTLTFEAIPNCQTLECINSGFSFTNGFRLVSDQGTKEYTSPIFNIETPNLVITKIDAPFMEGNSNVVVERKITIRNTRLGRLANFTYLDNYDENLFITTTTGTIQSNVNGKLAVLFSGVDFTQIGNNDEFFDFDEEIIITERISVKACIFNTIFALSDITAQWGCQQKNCQKTNLRATFRINPSPDSGDKVSIIGLVSNPDCYYDTEANQEVLVRKEPTKSALLNLVFRIDQNLEGRAIVVGSVVGPPGTTITYEQTYTNDCGIAVADIAEIILLRWEPNEAIEEFKIRWRLAFCEESGCKPQPVNWRMLYKYTKECAEPKDKSHNGQVRAGSTVQSATSSTLNLSSTADIIINGSNANLLYSLTAEKLRNPTGEVKIKLEIPAYLEIQNTSFSIGGKTPTNVSSNIMDGINCLELTYPLPFPNIRIDLSIPIIANCGDPDKLPCKDTLISSCNNLCINNITINSILGEALILINPDCNPLGLIKACTNTTFQTECFYGYCIDTLAGYFTYDFNVHRLTLGLPDKNNDGIPDDDGIYDLSQIKTDQIFVGDTFRISIAGRIQTDIPGSTFSHARVNIAHANIIAFGNRTEDHLLNGVQEIKSDLHIHDRSQGIWYKIENVPYTRIDFEFSYDISTAMLNSLDPQFPINYVYSNGDSIKFNVYKVFAKNLEINFPGWNEHQIKLDYRSKVVVDNQPIPPINGINACDCQNVPVIFAGYNLWSQWAIPSIGQCPVQTNINNINYTHGFPIPTPGELKILMRPIGMYIEKTPNIRFDSMGLSSSFIPTRYFKTTSETATEYYVDFSEFTRLNNFRENFRFWLFRQAEKCLSAPVPAGKARMVYELTELGQKHLPIEFSYTMMNFEIVPKIKLEVQQKEITVLSRNFNIPIKLTNQSSAIVRNVFVKPIYPAGVLKNVKLQLQGSQTNFPDINEYFILGNLTGNQIRNLSLSADAIDCDRQMIVLEYGYDCDIYSDPALEPCFLLRDTFFVEFPKGLLDLSPNEETKIADLCVPMPQTQTLFFNADLGYVYDLEVEVELPRGMNIIEGSCQIIYPAGSGQILNIPLPNLKLNRTFVWKLKDIWPQIEEGLLGVDQNPQNSFEIIFQTITDCDFISGTKIRHGIKGTLVCGEPTNEVVKIGAAYKITGIENDVSIQLQAQINNKIICDTEETLLINFTNQHTDVAKLYVSLPTDLEYVLNSAFGNLPNLEPTLQNGVLVWDLPSEISNVELSIKVKANIDASCANHFINIFTATQTDALCASINELCSIEVVSGEIDIPIQIEKANILIDQFTVLGTGNGIFTVKASVKLVGGDVNQNIVGKLYIDRDNDGMVGPADEFLENVSFGPMTFIGQITNGEITINTNNLSDLCNLLLVVDLQDNCICEPQIKPFLLDVVVNNEDIILCWNDAVDLGVANNAGNNYQWNIGEGLNCTQCSSATFYIPNEDFESKIYLKTLSESDPFGCNIIYNYQITVAPRQKILSTPKQICPKDTAIIFTTDTESYLWEGNEIIFNDGSYIEVNPRFSSTYYVTLTDVYGCQNTDSIRITVIDLPTIELITGPRYCYGQEANISYLPDSNFTYFWINGEGILSHPDSTFSTVLTDVDIDLYLRISNDICEIVDTIPISFYQGIDLVGIQDTFLICRGDTLLINLTGGTNYDWGPDFEGECLSADCSEVSIIVVNSEYNYVLNVTNDDGCVREDQVTILGVDEEIIEEEINLCDGETIVIFGQEIDKSGVYCDTISLSGGCKSINCKTLTYFKNDTSYLEGKICFGESFDFFGTNLSQSGTYQNSFNTIQGCDSIIILNLEVFSLPQITIEEEFEVLAGDSLVLNLPSNYIYQWSPPTGISCTTCHNPTITPVEDITYTVIYTDENGCENQKLVRIKFNDQCSGNDFILPNAFTPNNDGRNDYYTIPGKDFCELTIIVYNRWGNVVYEQAPFDNRWDGRSKNGEELPQGTYYVLVRVNNQTGSKTGMVDLRRK